MTRRAAVAVVVLLAWVAGSTIGSIAELPAAAARTPGIVFGRAHGGYTPDPTGRRTITILAIGMALTAIALGSWAGGRAADVMPPRRMLGPLLAVSGVAVAATPYAVRSVATGGDGSLTFLVASTAMLVPGAALSAVTPIVTKLRLTSLAETGTVVGACFPGDNFAAQRVEHFPALGHEIGNKVVHRRRGPTQIGCLNPLCRQGVNGALSLRLRLAAK